jgi:hypothetical protein
VRDINVQFYIRQRFNFENNIAVRPEVAIPSTIAMFK